MAQAHILGHSWVVLRELLLLNNRPATTASANQGINPRTPWVTWVSLEGLILVVTLLVLQRVGEERLYDDGLH